MKRLSLNPLVDGILVGELAVDMTWMVILQYAVVVILTGVSAVIDWRTRRIPNVITFPMMLSGLLFMGAAYGWMGLGDSILALLLLCSPYLLAFARGVGGAGDVKLMAGIGSWVGLEMGIWILISVLIAGGVWSVIVLLIQGRLREIPYIFMGALINLLPSRKSAAKTAEVMPEPEVLANSESGKWVPYAPAIFAGTMVGGILWAIYGKL